MFPLGTKLVYKHNNQPAYEKVDEELWAALNAYFFVPVMGVNHTTKKEEIVDYEKHFESETPMFRKDGQLNWTGFKWSDEMVFNYYKDIMTFEYERYND